MIDIMMKILTVVVGLNMLFYAFYAIIHVVLSSSSKSSTADQDPKDNFEVREEWKEFM